VISAGVVQFHVADTRWDNLGNEPQFIDLINRMGINSNATGG